MLSLIIIILFTNPQQQTNQNDTTYNASAAGSVAWQQFDGNAEKSGISNDPYINRSTLSSLRKVWQAPVSSDGSPVYLSGVSTGQGVKNLVFVTTKNGGLVAIDDASGKQVWSVSTSGGGGITTSSPAIDPGDQFIYNYGKDGKVHKYRVGTGIEDTSGGWPLTATVIPNVEKGSSALAIGNGRLYVAISAYVGDAGQYVGHIVSKNLSTGAVTVFNTLCTNNKSLLSGNCSNHQSGVWARPGTVVDVNTGNVFISSGNGIYAPPNNLGDSIVELNSDLSKIIDTYTPTNFQQLQDDDADLGSAVVGIIPGLELGIQGGKDNKVRVLNLKNLSGKGGPDHTGGELQTLSVNCNIFSHPISWADSSNTTWVFVTDMCNNLYAYKVSNNRLQQVYTKNGTGNTSPLMVNGILFTQSNGAVKAIDPTKGTILWTGQIGSMHWQSPAVVNGHIFALDNNNLTAFAVPNNTPTVAKATPGNPIPSNFVCLGSCPSPSPTKKISTTPSDNPSVSSVPGSPSGVQFPSITINPCTTTQAKSLNSQNIGKIQSYHYKHHAATKRGILQQFIQLLLLILQLLFQQLGVNFPVTTTPCPQPTNTTHPTSGASTSPIPVTNSATKPTIVQTVPSGTQVGTNTAACPNVVDPAYFYPPSYWPELLSSKDMPSTVGFIFNPASGPGTNVDQNLLAQVQKAKAAKMSMYAYVDTAYGKKSISSVETAVAGYKKLYGLTSIMFDEMSSNATGLSYYQTLINYVHNSATGSKVILNPGTYPDQAYMNLDATFNVFEGPYTSFVNDSVPGYVKTTAASKMSVVVYATSANNVTSALNLAKQRNAGTVYITDNSNSGNPYNTLPAYWSTELNQITANCIK